MQKSERVLLLLLLLAPAFEAPAQVLCPNGSYVSTAPCRMCPDGSYVDGNSRCKMGTDGRYTPKTTVPPDPGNSQTIRCPDGTYVAGTRCVLAPDGSYIGQ